MMPERPEASEARAPRSVRVVQVVPHWQLGGMQQVAMLLDEELPSRGITSQVVALDAVAGPSAAGRLRGWQGLLRQWRRHRPDAVMAHTMVNAAYSLSAARAAGVRQRVVVVHNSRASLGEAKTRLLVALCLSGTVTDVVFCGRAAGNSFRTLPDAVLRKTRVIRNGIRLPALSGGATPPAFTASTAPRPLEIITAGRLVDVKNLGILVDAARLCRQPVHLSICGSGPELEALTARASDVAAKVSFLGALSREELAERYASSDVFAFPSVCEGLPLVLLEAITAHLAVVASDLDFCHEVLSDAALYCAPDDAGAWAAAFDALCDPVLRQQLARTGGARAASFGPDMMVDGYAALLAGSAPSSA